MFIFSNFKNAAVVADYRRIYSKTLSLPEFLIWSLSVVIEKVLKISPNFCLHKQKQALVYISQQIFGKRFQFSSAENQTVFSQGRHCYRLPVTLHGMCFPFIIIRRKSSWKLIGGSKLRSYLDPEVQGWSDPGDACEWQAAFHWGLRMIHIFFLLSSVIKRIV